MALARLLNTDKRTVDLCNENAHLSAEVERLEDALTYYQNRNDAESTSTRGMLRQEIGGSRWQYGASGKLHDFRSANDLQEEQAAKPDSGKNAKPKQQLQRSSRSVVEMKNASQTKSQEHKRLSEPLKCLKPRAKQSEETVKPMTLWELERSEHLTTKRLQTGSAVSAKSEEEKPCDPQVERWLQGLSLKDTDRYIAIFAENEFDMISVKLLSDAQLKEMGIRALGARNKILQGVKLINGEDIMVSTDLAIEQVKKKVKPKAKKDFRKKDDDLDTIPVREPRSTRPQTAKTLPMSATAGGPNKPVPRPASARQSAASTARATSGRPVPVKNAKKVTNVPAKGAETRPKELKRTVNQNANDANRPVLVYDEPQTAISTYGQVAEKDDIIASLSSQVQKLLESQQSGDGKTLDMIVKLQEQISALRLQMNQKQRIVTHQASSEDLKVKVHVDDSAPKPASPNSKSLNDLTKITLLDKVRQQKNAYAKQIRHLELELDRLRGIDQQSCELPLEDLYYNDKDLVGEGVFSRVYRGQFQGVDVAVKRLKSPLNQQDKNYFAAEVSLLRELRHPRVVLLLGVTTTTHLPCMVLEFMGAGSLYEMLHASNTPPLDHVAYYQLAKDMAQGMNYLHRHKPSVLHLDLKSKNVLLNVYGRAKIGDFGFSKLRHEASINAASRRASAARDAANNAPSWMAPELLSAKPVTVKADVYSYAVILWEMLTRKTPHEGLSTYKVIEMVRQSQRPTIPESTPPRLSMLIAQCWDQNQAKRPQFKDILLTLGDLELPPEWRNFLQEANIPQFFLENSQSARQILDYVNMTLESMDTGSDFPVPQLNLTIDDFTDEEFLEICDSERRSAPAGKRHSVKFEQIQVPMVSSEYEQQTSETEKVSSTDEPKTSEDEKVEITKPETVKGDYRFDPMDRRGSRIRVLPPGPPKKRPSSDLTSLSDQDKESNPFVTVIPLPPPQPVPAPPPIGCSGVPLPPPPPPIMSPDKGPVKPAFPSPVEKEASFEFEIPVLNLPIDPTVTSARLKEQKSVLRSSLTPHPAQLRSLKDVPKQRLSNVADVLKQALAGRRLALMRDSITARSDDYLSEPDDWSRRCSLAPTHRDLAERPRSRSSSRLDVKRQSTTRMSDAEDDIARRLLIQSALDKLRSEVDETRRSSQVFEAWGADAASQSTPRLEVTPRLGVEKSRERSRSTTPTTVVEESSAPGGEPKND